MIPLDHHSGTDEEADRLAARLRRNRRRTRRILTVAILVAILWPLYVEFRKMQPAVPKVSFIKPVAAPRLPPRPASPDAKRKREYPYSVIPGGVYSGPALARALARDPIAAEHYAGFDSSAARPVRAAPGMRRYSSYRIGDRIYWTAKPIALHENETLLTDGVHLVRARCGNRLSETPQTPVGPQVELDPAATDESKAPWRESGPEEHGVLLNPVYPMSEMAPDIFPDIFVDEDGDLTIGAAAAAAQVTGAASAADSNETLSGYANHTPTSAPGGLGGWISMGGARGGVSIAAAGSGLPSASGGSSGTGTGTFLVIASFPGPGTASTFTDSLQADRLSWPSIVPAAVAPVWTAGPVQSDSLPPLSPHGPGESGWGPFNLVVSGIAAAERGALQETRDGGQEGGGGGRGGLGRGGGGIVSPTGFPVDPSGSGASIPEPGGFVLVALGLTAFALRHAFLRSRP